MIDRIIQAAEEYEMLSATRHITVALSGGADSMALLYALNSLKDRYGFRLNAAHVNHCLRGAESDSDERFVRQACRDLGIELVVKRIEIERLLQKGESIETAARRLRYEFLEKVARQTIATAHTASDNFETVLFNAVRGAGIKGLCGIPPVRDRIIRPLCLCTRSMVELYCRENNIDYCTDSTNTDTKYSRNKIRHRVVPILKEINPNVEEGIAKMSISLRQDSEYLESAASAEYKRLFEHGGLSLNGLNLLHISLKKRVIMQYYRDTVGRAPDRLHIESIEKLCSDKNGKIELTSEFFAFGDGERLIIEHGDNNKEDSAFYERALCENPQDTDCEFLSFELIERFDFHNFENVNKKLFNYAVDYDKIVGTAVIRNRLSGDKISLLKRNGTKTLKKLFIDSKIDVNKRDSIVLLADENGVFFVDGFGVDKRVAVDRHTERCLIIYSNNGR